MEQATTRWIACGETTALTLFRGWWSPFSFLIAPVVLVLNLLSRRKVADLPEPVRSEFVAPNLEPMQPVRPVLARPTSWIGPVLLIAVVLFLALRQPQTPRAGMRYYCLWPERTL